MKSQVSFSISDGVHPIFALGSELSQDKSVFCRALHYYRFKVFRDSIYLFDYNSSDVNGEVSFKYITYESSPYSAVEQHVIVDGYDVGVVVTRYPDPCYSVFPTLWSFDEWSYTLKNRPNQDAIFHNVFNFDAEPEDYDGKEYNALRLLGDLKLTVRYPLSFSDVDDIPVDIFGEWLKRHGRFDDYMSVTGRVPWVIGRALGIRPFAIRGLVEDIGFHNVFDGLVSEFSTRVNTLFHGYYITVRGLRVRHNKFWVSDPVIRVEHRRLGTKEVRLRGKYVITFSVSP